MLIHQNLKNLSTVQANKICLIHGNIQLTYQEFTQQVDCLAYRLATQIRKGDTVLVKLLSPVSQLLYFFGIIKAGGTCIFIDASTSEEVCAELIERHRIHLYIHEKFQLVAVPALLLPEVNHNDIFLGALSSGSTGTPKLIWRDHQSWTSAFPMQSKVFNISKFDTLYVVSSLVYTANLNACLHVLSEGGTVVIASNNRPRTWLGEITTHHVSAIFMVPANYKMLLKVMKVSLSQIQSVVTGGAKMDLHTVQSLISFFPHANICEYYGASELGHVSYSMAQDLLEHPESVGKAFPGVTLSIEDDCIYVQSPYLAPQYRPIATVGDLGRLDKDGYLYLLGRKQGIINTGGVKVIPEQVETILLQCPGITEAVVAGIADPLRGQRVCAWVVKNETTLTIGDILDFCRKKMRHHYCPHKIIFVDELPTNKNGKIDRIKLRNEEA